MIKYKIPKKKKRIYYSKKISYLPSGNPMLVDECARRKTFGTASITFADFNKNSSDNCSALSDA